MATAESPSFSRPHKNWGLTILSISDRDSKKLVTELKNAYHIKNTMYPDGGDVGKLYHVTGFPTFYVIDKEGKIANAVLGYHDDFEKKMTDIIDNLLKKS